MSSRSHSRSSRSRRPPTLTTCLQKCHFERLGDLASRPRTLANKLTLQALSLHNEHKKLFVACIKDASKHQWLVVADQSGVLWLTERHLVPDPWLANLITTYHLKPTEPKGK